jgi:hypothetical protein
LSDTRWLRTTGTTAVDRDPITNAARHGRTDLALMTLAGHSDFRVTKRYVHLAGEMFRDEAIRMEQALWGDSGTKSRYQEPEASPEPKTEEAPMQELR